MLRALALAVVILVTGCARPQVHPVALPSNAGDAVTPLPEPAYTCPCPAPTSDRYAVRLKYLECRVHCLKQQVWKSKARMALVKTCN